MRVTMKTILRGIIIISVLVFAIWLIFIAICGGDQHIDIEQPEGSHSFTKMGSTVAIGQGEIEVVQGGEAAQPEINGSRASGQSNQDVVGILHIRDKAFAVRDNVSAQTLKNSIGWLNNSSLPPDGGPCVLMGHRNTQFRILKDVEIGEQLVFENESGEQYTYEVKAVEILESDSDLRFYATDESSIVLVTCYPFYYSGHAPQKYVVTAVID